MEKQLAAKLWNGFVEMLKCTETLKDYNSYYLAIVSWLKINFNDFKKDILRKNRLDILIHLDPSIYITDKPDILLNMELKRLGAKPPASIDNLAMMIGDTLWDMVTIKSGKDCPNCNYDELRFLLVKNELDEESLILSCDSCGWTENIDGTLWNQNTTNVVPANKQDLKRFEIKYL